MIEFGELTGRLLNYRMAIARDVIPTSEQTFNALTSLRSEEGKVLLRSTAGEDAKLCILEAQERLLLEKGIEVPQPKLLLAGSMIPVLIAGLKYGLGVLKERGIDLPPPQLVAIETIRGDVIEPKFREITARFGEAIGDARSTEDVPQEALSDFVLNHDYWYGALVTLSPIATGLEYSKGESPELLRRELEHRSDYEGDDLAAPDAADIYVAHLGRFSRFAEVMGRDPTGFSLIDQIIDEMKNPNQPQLYGSNRNFRREQRFTVVEMVLAGAEFSSKLYKAIYPLVD